MGEGWRWVDGGGRGRGLTPQNLDYLGRKLLGIGAWGSEGGRGGEEGRGVVSLATESRLHV